MKDSGFFRSERTARSFNGVVVGHGPNVSQDEGGFSDGVTVEFFVSGPHNGTRNTTAFNGDVELLIQIINAVCFVGSDVELSFTQPRHVGHLAQHSGDFVDHTVIVGFGEDVAKALTVRTVSDAISCRRWVEIPCKGGNTNASCGCEEVVISFFIGVNETDGDPVSVLIKVFGAFAGESIALNQQSDTRKTFPVVAHGDLTGQFCAGVVLQNLHKCVRRLNLVFRDFAVPVGDNKVVHHSTRQRQSVGQNRTRRSGLSEML